MTKREEKRFERNQQAVARLVVIRRREVNAQVRAVLAKSKGKA